LTWSVVHGLVNILCACQTNSSASAERPHCRVEDCNWETIFYGHYRSVLNHCDAIGQQRNQIWWKKTQNKGYYAVQGHSRSSTSSVRLSCDHSVARDYSAHLGLRNPLTDRVEIWHNRLRSAHDPTCQNWDTPLYGYRVGLGWSCLIAFLIWLTDWVRLNVPPTHYRSGTMLHALLCKFWPEHSVPLCE